MVQGKIRHSYLKRFLGILVIVILLLVFFFALNRFAGHTTGKNYIRTEGFKNEDENSLDVVFIGSSDTYTSYSPSLAYGKYGYTSYSYGVDSAPLSLWKIMVENVLETQNPELFIVDVHGALYNNERLFDSMSSTHYIFDNMPMNEQKIERLNYVFREKEYDRLSYYYPFFLYHDQICGQLIEETCYLNKGGKLRLKGTTTETNVYTPDKLVTQFEAGTYAGQIYDASEEYLLDFVDFCKEKDLSVLFVMLPRVFDREKSTYELYMADYVGELVNQAGYEYINFQYQVDSIGLDYFSDFYNAGHMNIYGQKKFTDYIGAYLTEHYSFSHTEQLSEQYKAEWESAAEYYEDYYSFVESMIKEGTVLSVYDSPENYRLIDAYNQSKTT